MLNASDVYWLDMETTKWTLRDLVRLLTEDALYMACREELRRRRARLPYRLGLPNRNGEIVSYRAVLLIRST